MAAAIAACALLAGDAHAQHITASGRNSSADFRELRFCYFPGLGGQTADDREYANSEPARNKATTPRPLIVNGALF